jgi:type I restriction enzyme S subunit
MSKWNQSSVGDFIDFNPSESLPKDKVAKKVPMEKLGAFERKLKGFEYAEYKAGPKFRNGDTLVAKITPCLENGKTAFVDILNEDEVAYGSSEFIVLRENGRSDKKFIYYLARSPLFRDRAISCMEGTSGRKRVNEGALKRQEILIPQLKEQQKIAAVLSALDDKIELNNRINTELEQMAKTLYDYWFVQFDFPNAKGKPYKSSGGKMVYNEVLKREVPEGWEVTNLSEVNTFLSRGISPKYTEGNGVQVVNQRCVRNNTIDFSFCRMHNHLLKPVSKLLKIGDVLVNSTGVGTLGRVAVVRRLENEQTTTDSHVTIVRIDPEKANPLFVGVSILDRQFEIEQLGEGSTGQTELSRENLGKLKVLLPKREIQDTFGCVVMPLNQKISINEQENQQLATLRDWLLPMLMNGQAKVTGSHAQQEELLSIAAAPEPTYKKRTQLNIPSNKKGFAKQVLAGKIISLFKDDPHFTDIKFQKIQFLAEHIIQADLNLNYYY